MLKMNNSAFDPKILAVPILLAAIILFYMLPGYRQIEERTRYPDFQGLSPESHSFDGSTLELVLNNSFDQPVNIISIRSKEDCTYPRQTLQPLETMDVRCPNSDGSLSLSYSVSGMTIEVSGRIFAD